MLGPLLNGTEPDNLLIICSCFDRAAPAINTYVQMLSDCVTVSL